MGLEKILQGRGTRLLRVSKRYFEEGIHDFFLKAALNEKECYDEAVREGGRIAPLRPRIKEIAKFAKKIGAKKLGLAFCSGLHDEAYKVSKILQKHRIKIESVVCSCGSIDKAKLGIPPEYRIKDPQKFEAACNPLLQAELLNRAKTSFNILAGLCVGPDMIFTENSDAPVTTLLIKDRFTGHNPVISPYSRYNKDIV
jgi:uncharacterized metal-binding protein